LIAARKSYRSGNLIELICSGCETHDAMFPPADESSCSSVIFHHALSSGAPFVEEGDFSGLLDAIEAW